MYSSASLYIVKCASQKFHYNTCVLDAAAAFGIIGQDTGQNVRWPQFLAHTVYTYNTLTLSSAIQLSYHES